MIFPKMLFLAGKTFQELREDFGISILNPKSFIQQEKMTEQGNVIMNIFPGVDYI
jgi:hypothetical protein